jgi:hypothetical protein
MRRGPRGADHEIGRKQVEISIRTQRAYEEGPVAKTPDSLSLT